MSAIPAARLVARCRACFACLVCFSFVAATWGAVVAAPMQRDVAYGGEPAERYDVYVPAGAGHAPAVFFIHGGAWAHDDEATPGFLDAKLARWLPLGYVVTSVDYPLLPRAHPLEQARDVRCGREGCADSSTGRYVLVDTAALDVASVMHSHHARLYDRAFGSVPRRWPEQSPLALLSGKGPPILAVWSTRWRMSCPGARAFVAKASSFGTAATLVEEDMSRAEINRKFGEPSAYTDAVDAFMRGCVTEAAPMR